MVYNSGGEVVNEGEFEPIYGGNLLLINEEGEVVSLGMYKENRNKKDFKVLVESLEEGNLFNEVKREIYDSLNSLRKESIWKKFSQVIYEEFLERKRILRERLK